MVSKRIFIPDFLFGSLEILKGLTEDQKKSFLEEIKKLKPLTLDIPDDFFKNISEKLNINIQDANKLFDLLIEFYLSFYIVRNERDLPLYLSNVKDEIEKIGEPKIIPSNWEEFINFWKEALSIDAIGTIAKADFLQREQYNLFFDARIYTDIRPIFSIDTTKNPENAVIYHNLKIIFGHETTTKDIFISLNPGDLIRLKNVIDRAINKEALLKKLFKNKNLTIIQDEKE